MSRVMKKYLFEITCETVKQIVVEADDYEKAEIKIQNDEGEVITEDIGEELYVFRQELNAYDDICLNKYGHTSWVKLDTLSDQEKVGLDEVAEIQTINGVQVAFYFEF